MNTIEEPTLFDLGKAHARPTDPQTSHEAAASVDVRRSRDVVLALLSDRGPLPDHALVMLASPYMSASRARTARAELVKQGLVRRSNRDGRTPAGRRCQVWEVAQ